MIRPESQHRTRSVSQSLLGDFLTPFKVLSKASHPSSKPWESTFIDKDASLLMHINRNQANDKIIRRVSHSITNHRQNSSLAKHILGSTLTSNVVNQVFLQMQQNAKLSKWFAREHINPELSPQKAINYGSKTANICKNMFETHFLIGKGSYGKVWMVESKVNGEKYAMKEINKARVITKKAIRAIMNQREFLQKLSHPFINNLHYAFQDNQNVYILTDYANGGDLRYRLNKKYQFSEEQVKFIMGNLLIVLQYLHENKIIHRDLKPENIILHHTGYLKLVDFGISRKHRSYNRFDSSGTPIYMAPEVLMNKSYSYEVDYYALGVICYQLVTGKRPFQSNDRSILRQQLMIRQFQLKQWELPSKQYQNGQVLDFVNRLLKRRPQERLGHKSVKQIMSHPWLESMDWQALQRQRIPSPCKLINIQQDHKVYCESFSSHTTESEQSQKEDLDRKSKHYVKIKNVEQIFKDFHHFPLENPIRTSVKQAHTSNELNRTDQTRNYFD